jgi:PPOX class probable F420-dependent enzyme
VQTMTPDEVRSFLLTGTRTAKLATVRADGRPHLAPVWFVLDGDDILFNTSDDTVKARNIRRDARVSIVVDDETYPYAFVMIEGTATLSDDLDAVRAWATRIGARYAGDARAEEYGARNGVPGELLVRVTPANTIGQTGIAD